MAPSELPIDWDLVVSVAKEVAETEAVPSRTKLANRLGMVSSTLNKRAGVDGKLEELDAILQRKAHVINPGLEPEGLSDTDEGKVGIVNPKTPWSTEDVIRFFGDDPAECIVKDKRGTFWGQPEKPNHHLRVNWIARKDTIQAADPTDWTPPPKPKKPRKDAPRSAVLVSDQHCPHQDQLLHRFFCRWLEDNEPDEGYLMGDLLDFSSISRHRERDGWCQSVNECLQAAFNVLRDYRHASPKTSWKMIRGNHCSRLEYAILDGASGLHRVSAAGDDVPALSLRRLLHLDDMGIEFVDEDWDRARMAVSSKLTARHGPATGKAATDRLLSKYARSTVQGHTHRLSLKFRTEHTEDEDEPTITRLGGEVGCMCEIKDSLGYGSDEDWQQGFMAATIWPDGDFHLTPCTYIPGRLLTPGKRYT